MANSSFVSPWSTATKCQDAISLIKQAEGFRECTYRDTKELKTICYGFNLEVPSARAKIEAVGGNWDSVYFKDSCLTESQCTILLKTEVERAVEGAEEVFGKQCKCIFNVLTDVRSFLEEL